MSQKLINRTMKRTQATNKPIKIQKENQLLREEINRLENIIALMPENVYWLDKNGYCLGCNNNLVKLTSYKDREEVIGKLSYQMMPKEFREKTRKRNETIIKTGEAQTFEEEGISENGSKAIYLTKKAPIFDLSKKIIGLVGISMDITERKKMEKELKEAKKRIESAAMIKDKLQQEKINDISIVCKSIAHELRTPLLNILGNADSFNKFFTRLIEGYNIAKNNNLLNDEIQPRHILTLRSSLQHIKEEASISLNIISALLNIAVQSSVNFTDKSTYSIMTCVNEAIKNFQTTHNRCFELIDLDIKNDFDFFGSKLLIIQVILNLFRNAFYYVTKSGKGRIKIWLSNENKLHFKDTSVGIHKNNISKIFDPLYSGRSGGAGIGLSFCKIIMKDLGGNIRCMSVENEYTEFVLEFPKKIILTSSRRTQPQG